MTTKYFKYKKYSDKTTDYFPKFSGLDEDLTVTNFNGALIVSVDYKDVEALDKFITQQHTNIELTEITKTKFDKSFEDTFQFKHEQKRHKQYLQDTDWMVMREFDGGKKMTKTIKEKRAKARKAIK